MGIKLTKTEGFECSSKCLKIFTCGSKVDNTIVQNFVTNCPENKNKCKLEVTNVNNN